MSDELKPCPFCGGEVELEKTIDRREWWGVVCRNAKNIGGSCALSIRPSASKNVAIRRWNARPSEWQPIETAPKDKLVLLFFDVPIFGKSINKIVIGFLDSRSEKWFIRLGEVMGVNELAMPTRWMPLPQPPTNKE